MPEPEVIREIVCSNLDAARDNGYFNEGEYLHKATVSEIALDMAGMAVDCEEIPADDLMPYIQKWLEDNKLDQV